MSALTTSRRRHRDRRRVATLLPAAFLCPLLLLSCDGEPEPEETDLAGRAAGWNVLLLSVDTLRADRVGAYGYTTRETSPSIDRLLGRGVMFERAHAPRALTWPSLASVLTGLYPSGHGLLSNGYAFADGQRTLARILHERGYRTAAFLSNMCRANHQGWDAFHCAGGQDAKVTRGALEWLGQEGDGATDAEARPFFLWTHYFGPHPPYYNGGDLAARVFDPGYEGELEPKKWILDRVMIEGLELDDADVRHLDAIYDAAVKGTDNSIGALLAGLEEAGRLDQTLIVFLADHGEDLYRHNGYLYHGCSVYESSLHVPLAFIAPGLIAGSGRVAQDVELIDVLPTLLDLLGLEPDPAERQSLHGVSLRPLLESPQSHEPGRPAFSEYDLTRIRTVVADGWKLISNPDEVTPVCMPGAPEDLYPIARHELYDLERDPAETHNLAASHPDRIAELERLLQERFAGLDPTSDLTQELSDELKEELEALGYVAN